MPRKNIAKLFYGICAIFIAAGAVNYGFSGFAPALPFMLAAIALAKKISRKAMTGTMLACIAAIAFNMTVARNPLVFPILNDGYVTINENGYLRTYSDGSGGFSSGKETFGGGGQVTFRELRQGETYKITGVKIGHPEFATTVSLVTEIGQFSEEDYKTAKHISPSKPAVSDWADKLSFLMNYPVAFFYLGNLAQTSMPWMNVLVEDDSGQVRKGRLSPTVTSGRLVKSGDTVRLNCVKAPPLPGRKLCKIEFRGFDPNSACPKGSPCYGKIPDFSVSVDETGVPDKNLLILE
ncbi:MAG: hypothetical protein WDO70_09830 [Alphaproteobacteria bacterium]